MERFHETLRPEISEEKSAEIAKEMVTELQSAKSKKPLAQHADLRDEKVIKGPCAGHHRPQGFGRGSLTGTNGHALWVACSQCRLRLLYVPSWGAKAVYRSAGPLGRDVSNKLANAPTNEITPSQLETQAIGPDAAEVSAMKEKKGMGKGKGTTVPPNPVATPTPEKKEQKRPNSVSAEVQEAQTTAVSSTPSSVWSEVTG